MLFFFFQAEDGIRDKLVTGVQTCALPIWMGLMQGIEFVEDRKTKEPSPKKTTAFLEAAKRQGLLIGKGGLYGNVIRIAPSMLISKSDIDDGCQRMERALAEVK